MREYIGFRPRVRISPNFPSLQGYMKAKFERHSYFDPFPKGQSTSSRHGASPSSDPIVLVRAQFPFFESLLFRARVWPINFVPRHLGPDFHPPHAPNFATLPVKSRHPKTFVSARYTVVANLGICSPSTIFPPPPFSSLIQFLFCSP